MSGIYIPNIKMPKNCYECPIRRRMGLYIICTVTKEEFSIADKNILFYRLEDCPLIPVPDHGELVERDDVVNDVRLFICQQCGDYCGPDATTESCDYCDAAKLIKGIKRRTTVILSDKADRDASSETIRGRGKA